MPLNSGYGVIKIPSLSVSYSHIVLAVGYVIVWHTYSLFFTSNILNLMFALFITSFVSASILITFNLAVISALDITSLISWPSVVILNL